MFAAALEFGVSLLEELKSFEEDGACTFPLAFLVEVEGSAVIESGSDDIISMSGMGGCQFNEANAEYQKPGSVKKEL